MSGGLITRGIGSGSALTDFNTLASPPVDFVNRELGLNLYVKKQESLVSAMATPAVWLDERNAKLLGSVKTDGSRDNDGINTKVATFYQAKLNKYQAEGFSQEQAMAMAAKSANRYLQEELDDLEITHPGSTTVFASAAHQMADRNTKFGLATGAAESSLNKKAIYKEYRQKKKEKKARKLAKANKA